MAINEVRQNNHRWSVIVALSVFVGLAGAASANTEPSQTTQPKQARMPRVPQNLPVSPEQAQYNLPLSQQDRAVLTKPSQLKQPATRSKRSPSGADCRDMSVMTQYRGAALADYIANLPDYECHYGLFSVDKAQAMQIFNAENVHAVASRFVQEIYKYDASNLILVNLLIYLRPLITNMMYRALPTRFRISRCRCARISSKAWRAMRSIATMRVRRAPRTS